MSKLGCTFSGQGSQYVGMGKKLCEEFAVAKETFEEANDLLGFNLMRMCFEDSKNELVQTENAQPAILAYSIALYRTYISEFGKMPSVLAGHSLGEYSALTCADVIDFKDSLNIVRKRGLLMRKASSDGAMAAIIGVDKEIIEEYCAENCKNDNVITISNYNTLEQTIISGNKDAVERAVKRFESNYIKARILNVSGAFHSPLMNVAAKEFKNELDRYQFKEPKYTVISNIDALPYLNSGDIRKKLISQLVSPVKWVDTMKYFYDNDVNLVIEFGPRTVIRDFFRAYTSNIKAISFEDYEDKRSLKDVIFQKRIDKFNSTLKFIDRILGQIACTKNCNWDSAEYMDGVITPTNRIKEFRNEIEIRKKEADRNEIEEIVNMLKLVFNTKRISMSEKIERYNEIIESDFDEEIQKVIRDIII